MSAAAPRPETVAGGRSVDDRPDGADVLPLDTLPLDMALHQGLVDEEVGSDEGGRVVAPSAPRLSPIPTRDNDPPVADRLTHERRDLALENACDALLRVDLGCAVKWTSVELGSNVGLRLEPDTDVLDGARDDRVRNTRHSSGSEELGWKGQKKTRRSKWRRPKETHSQTWSRGTDGQVGM